MIPPLELYLHESVEAVSSWVTEDLRARYESALIALLPELLAMPQGPDHVLSTLEVVEMTIVDDDTIAQVHADYLDDPTPTDAITFPYGEVLVSFDTAERYASDQGLDREEELFRYLVHGLVHLHGYLDYETADREALFAVQEPLVQKYWC